MDSTLAKVLGACELLYQTGTPDEFSARLLKAIKVALPSHSYSWQMADTRDARVISACFEDDRGPVDLGAILPAYLHYIREHPVLVAHFAQGGVSPIVARSDLLGDTLWRRTNFHNLVLAPYGIGDQLALTVRSSNTLACLCLNLDVPVSDTSRRVLHLLAPHITSAMRATLLWSSAQSGERRHGRVVLSPAGKVQEMPVEARALLLAHFPHCGTTRGGGLPPSIRTWVDTSTHSLWSRDRIGAPANLTVRTERGALGLTLLTEYHTRRHVILLTEMHDAQASGVACLTRREREVWRWIAQGKRNDEIAAILNTRPSTVKSQVESILRKLHVENRGAAAAIWHRTEQVRPES